MRPAHAWALVALLCSLGSARGNEEQARVHFQRGTNAFDLGRYDEAIREYEAAYSHERDPALLYNIAQAARLAGHDERALRLYKAYLQAAPSSLERTEVMRFIARLQARMASRQAERSLITSALGTAPADTPPPPPSPPPWYRDPLTATLAGLGVVGLGVGVGFVTAGALDSSRAATAVDLQRHDELRRRGRAFQIGGAVALGAGAALLTAALVRWGLSARAPRGGAASAPQGAL